MYKNWIIGGLTLVVLFFVARGLTAWATKPSTQQAAAEIKKDLGKAAEHAAEAVTPPTPAPSAAEAVEAQKQLQKLAQEQITQLKKQISEDMAAISEYRRQLLTPPAQQPAAVKSGNLPAEFNPFNP